MGTNYNPHIVTDGLVMYYDFANSNSYPGSGATVYDLTRFGRNATLINAAAYDSSLKSMVFSGSNEYMTMPPSILPSSGFTVDMWTLHTDGTHYGIWISEFQAIVTTSNINRRWYNNNTTAISFAESFSVGLSANFRHVVWTIGSYIDIVYINGEMIGTNRNTTIASPTITGYGGTYNLHYYNRSETVDNANSTLGSYRIYNKALSASEVAQNFNAGRSRYGV